MKQLLLSITLISISSISFAADVMMDCNFPNGFGLVLEENDDLTTLKYEDGYFKDEVYYRHYGKWINICSEYDVSCKVKDLSVTKVIEERNPDNINDWVIVLDFLKRKLYFTFSSSEEPFERHCRTR